MAVPGMGVLALAACPAMLMVQVMYPLPETVIEKVAAPLLPVLTEVFIEVTPVGAGSGAGSGAGDVGGSSVCGVGSGAGVGSGSGSAFGVSGAGSGSGLVGVGVDCGVRCWS